MPNDQQPEDHARPLDYAAFQTRWADVDFPPHLRHQLILDEEMRTCLVDAALPHLKAAARRRFLGSLERGLLDGRRAWLGALQQLERHAIAAQALRTTSVPRGTPGRAQ